VREMARRLDEPVADVVHLLKQPRQPPKHGAPQEVADPVAGRLDHLGQDGTRLAAAFSQRPREPLRGDDATVEVRADAVADVGADLDGVAPVGCPRRVLDQLILVTDHRDRSVADGSSRGVVVRPHESLDRPLCARSLGSRRGGGPREAHPGIEHRLVSRAIGLASQREASTVRNLRVDSPNDERVGGVDERGPLVTESQGRCFRLLEQRGDGVDGQRHDHGAK
jgi:hypothetical protein